MCDIFLLYFAIPLTSDKVLLFKTTEQPRVLKGNISVVVAQVLLIGVLLTILHLSNRDQRREAKKAQDD